MLWTLIIQGAGALSALALVVALGTVLGPSAQGLFSRMKAELEFVSALCLFGMPQAVFFFVSKGRLDTTAALRITRALAAAATLIALAYGSAVQSFHITSLVAFATGVLFMVAHGMLRVLVLSHHDTRAFNAVTVLPQLIIWPFASFLFGIESIEGWHVSVVFALSFFVASLLTLAVVRRVADKRVTEGVRPVGYSDLLGYGGAAWSVAVLNSGAYVLCLRAIEAGVGLDNVGVFSMGIVAVQAVLTPLNYAAPLLFKLWIDKRPDETAVIRIATSSALGALFIVGVFVGCLDLVSERGLLGSYAGLQNLKYWLGGVAVVEATTRTMTALANAYGRPWIPAIGELTRLLVLALSMGSGLANDLNFAIEVWLLAATAALTVLLVATVKLSSGGRWV